MHDTHSDTHPKKVAIIGGGVGAITAAYALTELPDWQSKFDITVYQLGWRLGGKGASGRNADFGQRIEEHGLHVWAGFYDNAFFYMKSCYENLVKLGLRKKSDPLGVFLGAENAAFKPLNKFYLAEFVSNESDGIAPLRIDFQPNDEAPGSRNEVPSPFAFLQQLLEFMVQTVEDLERDLGRDLGLRNISPPNHHLNHIRRRGIGSAHDSPVHRLSAFANALSPDASTHTEADMGVMLDLAHSAHESVRGMDDTMDAVVDWRRNLSIMLDLSIAFVKGMLDSEVFTQGFDTLDDIECSAWFLKYGASATSVKSAVLRGCYDYVFGYPGGVITDREVGAGTALRGLLRLAFTFKGSLFFEMQAGMGDTIFAPYYQVMRQRGVRFKFFHAATALRLDDKNAQIETIEMVEQVGVKSGEYDPLVPVRGLPCWPSEPDWSQLVSPDKSKNYESEKDIPTGKPLHLKRGVDFDDVILGASIGSLPYLAEDLIAASSRWKDMVDNVGTVSTQALQLWMDVPVDDLGWHELVKEHNPHSDDDNNAIMTAFSEPLDTWADLTHLIEVEDWGAEEKVTGFAEPYDAFVGKGGSAAPEGAYVPKSLAYFCSPAQEPGDYDISFHDQVVKWLDEEVTRIWPKAQTKAGKFDYALLHDPKERSGKNRLKAQYFRQNFYGSERYVLSRPGSVQYRLRPGESGFQNLYLAGDWTVCGINAGCVEAATISGLGAARSLSGEWIEITGEGDMASDARPQDMARMQSPFPQNADWPLTPFFSIGRLDGWFSFHALPVELIEQMLPKGTSLSPQAVTAPGFHPITILNSHQQGVRPSFLPSFGPLGDYRESILAISHVNVEGHDGTFSYLPTLYLDRELPIVLGKFFYALAKKRAKIVEAGSSYRVDQENGGTVWHARYAARSKAAPAMDFAGLGKACDIIEQPMVSVRPFGGFHFSAFDFGLSAAYAAPVSAKIEIGERNGFGLPAETLSSPPLGEERGQLPGAFRLWTSWTLSNPFDGGRVSELADRRARLAKR